MIVVKKKLFFILVLVCFTALSSCTRTYDFVVINNTDKTIKEFIIDADIRGRRELTIGPNSTSKKVFLPIKKRCLCVTNEIWFTITGYVDGAGNFHNQNMQTFVKVRELSSTKTNSFIVVPDSSRKSKIFSVDLQ